MRRLVIILLLFVAACSESKHYCTQSERDVDVCTTEYDPVCGWFDPEEVQCLTEPCAHSFSNNCIACRDPNVLYTSAGVCPTSS